MEFDEEAKLTRTYMTQDSVPYKKVNSTISFGAFFVFLDGKKNDVAGAMMHAFEKTYYLPRIYDPRSSSI